MRVMYFSLGVMLGEMHGSSRRFANRGPRQRLFLPLLGWKSGEPPHDDTSREGCSISGTALVANMANTSRGFWEIDRFVDGVRCRCIKDLRGFPGVRWLNRIALGGEQRPRGCSIEE